MRKLIFVMLVLLGGATSSLQGQNSFGIRVSSFNPKFSTSNNQGTSNTDFSGGLSLGLVRDWAAEGPAFWRGRFNLNINSSRSPLGGENFSSRNRIATDLYVGRGRRIDLAPFAFSYGGEVGFGFTPIYRAKYQFRGSDGSSDFEVANSENHFDAALGGGVFLQLDWNIHRNIWIGIEQRFLAAILYGKRNAEDVYSSTPIGGGPTTTIVDKSVSSGLGFSHPFGLANPVFSLTFRPGGK